MKHIFDQIDAVLSAPWVALDILGNVHYSCDEGLDIEIKTIGTIINGSVVFNNDVEPGSYTLKYLNASGLIIGDYLPVSEETI